MRTTRIESAPLGRRQLLGLASAVTAAGWLGGCGLATGADTQDGATGEADGWKFTDTRGETVRLDRQPERIVAFVGAAAALWDYGVRVDGVVGPSKRADGSRPWQAGRLELEGITSLGNQWGEFNLEAYAGLEPDLFVSVSYGDEFPLWYVPEESEKEIAEIAEMVGIEVSGVPLTEPLEAFERLARALGADLDTPDIKADKERFHAASGDLANLMERQSDLTVLAASAGPDQLYVSVPDLHNPDLAYFAEHGVNIVVPDEPLDQGGFWKYVSWENAGAYPADVILYDAREQATPVEELADIPTWANLPAVQAGQILPWRTEAPHSYLQYADVLEELIDGLSSAKRVVES